MTKNLRLRLNETLAMLGPIAATCCLRPPVGQMQEPISDTNQSTPQFVSNSRLVIWDGNGGGKSGGKGWAGCDDKVASCKATLSAETGSGRSGTRGLLFHSEGRGWSGFGWNWFGFFTRGTTATDLRPYTHLAFWIRVPILADAIALQFDALKLKLMSVNDVNCSPGFGGRSFGLHCTNGKSEPSAGVSLFDYDKSLSDGKWHKITIPLSDIYVRMQESKFDLTKAWEFQVTSVVSAPANFNIIMDDVVFD